MVVIERYPFVLRCEGSRVRPRRVALLPNIGWRVDWMDGRVTVYSWDPRADLRLGYDPKHLRQRDMRCA